MKGNPMADQITESAFKILLIAPRPTELDNLPNLDQRSLVNALKDVKAPVLLKILRPPTRDRLSTEIFNDYTIVHFDGHGYYGPQCPKCGMPHDNNHRNCSRCFRSLDDQDFRGYLAFEKEDASLDLLSSDDFADVISSSGSQPKLIILSACNSAVGDNKSFSKILSNKGVPAVLGMKKPISAKETKEFFTHIYAALGVGNSVTDALQFALKLDKNSLSDVIQLEMKDKDVKLMEIRRYGDVNYEPEPLLYGVPSTEFIGDHIYEEGKPPNGRKGYLARLIQEILDRKRLIVLTGEPGIGKATLAAEVAKRIVWRYPGGVFWWNAPIKRFELNDLLDVFAPVFSREFLQSNMEAKRNRVLSYLEEKPSLLVITNAESIINERKKKILLKFLETIPLLSAALITTSMAPPYGSRTIRLEKMEEGESERLFEREASEQSNRWRDIIEGKETLSQEERSDKKKISKILGGHPLGLKVAAGMLSIISLHDLLCKLVTHPPKDVTELFDLSYGLLSENGKDLFGSMSVFAGSIGSDAIETICRTETYSSQNIKDDLIELVRKSFIVIIEGENPRYAFHSLMHQYAAEKIGGERGIELSRKAARFFFLKAVEHKNDFDSLEQERENILAGMDWFFSLMSSSFAKEQEAAASCVIRFMDSLDDYLDVRGYWNEYRKRLFQAKKAAELLKDTREIALWTLNLGILFWKTEIPDDEAKKFYQNSLENFRTIKDMHNISRSLHNLGMIAQDTGSLDEAQNLYRQSLEIFQKLGDNGGISRSLQNLGSLAQAKGNYDKARLYYERSLTLLRPLGDKKGLATTLHQLGLLAYLTSDYGEAKKLYQQSLEIYQDQEIGDKSGISRLRHNQGLLFQASGNYRMALRRYQESNEMYKNLGDKSGISRSLHCLGSLAQSQGDLNKAREYYQESKKLKTALHDSAGECSSLHHLAMLESRTGDYETAHKLYEHSFENLTKMEINGGISGSLHQQAMLAHYRGNYEEARRLYQESLTVSQNLGDKSGISKSWHQLGILEHDLGDFDKARSYYYKSMKISLDIRDRSSISKSHHQLGMLAHDLGNYKEAEFFYNQSLEIDKDLGDKNGISKSQHQLGMLMHDLGSYDKAENYYNKSLKIKRDLKDSNGISRSLHQLGMLAQNKGKHVEARRCYRESQEILNALGNKNAIAISTAQFSLLEEASGNNESALNLIRQAEKIFLELGSCNNYNQARMQREQLERKN
jgi:tetratricopeptide (TPR) repeat protein